MDWASMDCCTQARTCIYPGFNERGLVSTPRRVSVEVNLVCVCVCVCVRVHGSVHCLRTCVKGGSATCSDLTNECVYVCVCVCVCLT